MTYQVLARKWRPQAFDAVVGQDAITRTLRNALAADRIAHAYLFAGPRGVGKTTTARLLARALLCPERKGPEPCGCCDVCKETLAGAAVDVLEIDGASNRGIDEVRTLRENVKYAPSRGRYKVYIIDEVHQLTEAAFNALLKTLEEPPAHVVFILATTDPREIPATVLSRVQRFDFRPIAPEALSASLERILREENVPFEPTALPAVIRAAEGSLRDALSLVDTAIAYGAGKLEERTVATLLGATAPVEVRAFVSALIAYDSAAALSAIDRAVREGEDLGAFIRDVIELLRQTTVLKAAPTAQLAELTPTEGNELRKLGESVSLDELLYIVRAFVDADALMRESPHPRVELEIATVRATRRPVPQQLEEVLRRVDEVESRLRREAPAAGAALTQESLLGSTAPATAPSPSRAPASDARRPAAPPVAPRSGSPDASPRSESPSSTRGTPPAGSAPRDSWSGSSAANEPAVRDTSSTASREASTTAGADTPREPSGDLATGWQRVIDEIMKKRPMLGATLMHARPGSLVSGQLTVIVTGNSFLRETIAERANYDLLRETIRRNIAGVERFTVTGEEPASAGIVDHPAVQAAIAEFEGEVVAVRPRPPEGDGQ